METIPIFNTKFDNGEVSPLRYSDVSSPKYGASLRRCLNWFAIGQGALVKRPGTQYIAPVRNPAAPRSIPFVFSDSLSYVLEVGDSYIRFIRNRALVKIAIGSTPAWSNAVTYAEKAFSNFGGVVYRSLQAGNLNHQPDVSPTWWVADATYEILTPWVIAAAPYLKYAQIGNVATLAYGGQAPGFPGTPAVAPQDLVHTAGVDAPWALRATPLKIPAGAVTWPGSPTITIDVYGYTGAATGPAWKKGERSFWVDGAGVVTEWISIQDGTKGSNQKPPDPAALNTTGSAISGNLFWMPAVDLSHTALNLQWVQTAVVQDAAGVTYESQPSPIGVYHSSLALDRQLPVGLATAGLAAGYTLLYYRLYRGTPGGIYGWVNDILPANLVTYPSSPAGPNPFTNVYLDDGRSPDYTRQPPAGTDPFLVGGADVFPTVIGYLDQRRVWAGSLPATLNLSKAGDLYNYDSHNTPGADTDATAVTLISGVLEEVRSIVQARRGLLFTSSGEWLLSGLSGGPVSRSSQDPKQQSGWGSSWLSPLKIGTGVLYNTAKNNQVRELFPLYGTYTDIWDGDDISHQARHFLEGHTIVSWAYQAAPHSIVWLVREDGVLLSVTYVRPVRGSISDNAVPIVAWAQHSISGGFVEQVAVVPEPPEDAVYLVVRRTIAGVVGHFHERLNNLIPPTDPKFANCLDMGVVFNGRVTDASTVQLSGGTYLAGTQATATASVAKFAAADAGKSSIVFDPDGTLFLGPVTARIVGYTSPTVVTVEFDADLAAQVIAQWATAATTVWAIGKSQFNGPWRSGAAGYAIDSGDVDGSRGIAAVADGNEVPQPGLIVFNGTITIPTPAVDVTIGLAYNSDVELLPVYHPSMELRGRFENIVRVGFEVAGTRDMWIGKDLNPGSLVQWAQRAVLDSYNVLGLQTGYFEDFVPGEWTKYARGALRHFGAMPAVLTSVMREVRLGDT